MISYTFYRKTTDISSLTYYIKLDAIFSVATAKFPNKV